MPSLEKHKAISRKRTGNDFRELHEWIDSPHKDLGWEHRIERHALNKKDQDFIRNKWGEKAVVEWLFHIALDNLETAFKKSRDVYGENTYNFIKIGFSDNGFIHVDFEPLDEEELEEEFEEDL